MLCRGCDTSHKVEVSHKPALPCHKSVQREQKTYLFTSSHSLCLIVFLSRFCTAAFVEATPLCSSSWRLVYSRSAVAVFLSKVQAINNRRTVECDVFLVRAVSVSVSARHYPVCALPVNPAVKHPSYPLPGPITMTHGLRGSGRHRAGCQWWKRASCQLLL